LAQSAVSISIYWRRRTETGGEEKKRGWGEQRVKRIGGAEGEEDWGGIT